MYQRSAALHTFQHNFTQTSQQQHIHLVLPRFAFPPPKPLIVFATVGGLEQLRFTGLTEGCEKRAERPEIQLERRVFKEPIDLLRQHAYNFGRIVRRQNAVKLTVSVRFLDNLRDCVRAGILCVRARKETVNVHAIKERVEKIENYFHLSRNINS